MHTSKSETSFASTKPLESASYSMESFDAIDKNDTESNGVMICSYYWCLTPFSTIFQIPVYCGSQV